MKVLHCNNNQLTQLDVLGNASLEVLQCDKNQLDELKLPARNIPYFDIDNQTKPGYTFNDWYTDPKCTSVWDGNHNFTSTTSLYTSWTADHGTTLKIIPKTLSLDVTAAPQSETLTFIHTPHGYNAVNWSSSDTTVATVDDNGLVTAVSAGRAMITVSSKADPTVKDTCAVTVTITETAPTEPPESEKNEYVSKEPSEFSSPTDDLVD